MAWVPLLLSLGLAHFSPIRFFGNLGALFLPTILIVPYGSFTIITSLVGIFGILFPECVFFYLFPYIITPYRAKSTRQMSYLFSGHLKGDIFFLDIAGFEHLATLCVGGTSATTLTFDTRVEEANRASSGIK